MYGITSSSLNISSRWPFWHKQFQQIQMMSKEDQGQLCFSKGVKFHPS